MSDASQNAAPASADQQPLPVVAIGASAGGLTQLQRLFADMPEDTGAAFVVMLHLAPDHASELPALLSHQTRLEVVSIDSGMPLEANRIHVLPPGYQPSLAHDTLCLTRQPTHSAMAGVIDACFRSLAEARHRAAIGIVLSGSGSDGAAGAKAIKTHGGLIMVQASDKAEYDSMPRAVVAAVDVDFAADTPDLIEPLCNHLRSNCAADTPRPGRNDTRTLVSDERLQRIIGMLETPQAHDFSHYKPNMLRRRIQRRMGLAGLADSDAYERRLAENAAERRQLVQDFLISVTDFFRDPATYETLEHEALDKLLDAGDANTPLRIWVPGCATGEEAYSVAMCAAEATDTRGDGRPFIIFASDIDQQALEVARQGRYPEAVAADVPEARLSRFFNAVGQGYRVKRWLRERVVFAAHDVLHDPPYANLDLVSCRNLLMYLNTDSQKRLLATFHFALNRSGFLFLGNAETIGGQIDLFEPVAKEHRLFQRIGTSQHRELNLPFVPQLCNRRTDDEPGPGEVRNIDEIEKTACNILLQEQVPATVLINRKHEILCSYGPTRDYFALPLGQTSLDLMAMVHEAYRSPLRAVIHRAFRDNMRSQAKAMRYDDRTAALRIVARPLEQPDSVRGVLMVTFEHAPSGETAGTPPTDTASDAERRLYDELEDTRHELHTTIQALEASNEDLKGSNEQILSMNEELQSTNEELETSKEELQSTNDELETKLADLETAHNDLYNLFSGTQLATLFLDRELCIKRFTPTVRDLLSVIDADVGRPLADINRKLDDPDLLDDASQVLVDLMPRDQEIPAANECWYLRRVQPYRTQRDAIDGVVITFTDITDLKRAAMATRESEQQLDLAMSTLHGGIWDMALDLDQASASSDRLYISPHLKALLGYRPDQFPDSLVAWRERIVSEYEPLPRNPASQARGAGYAERRYQIRHRDGSLRWFSSRGRMINDEHGRPVRWIGIDHDVTAEKEAEDRRRRLEAQLQTLADAVPQPLVYADRGGTVRLTNNAWRDAFATAADDTLDQQPLATWLAPDAHNVIHPCIQRALDGYIAGNQVRGLVPGGSDQQAVYQVSCMPHTVDGETLGVYVLISNPTSSSGWRNNQLGPRSGLVYLQRMATIGELASTLAHDLRQPLSAIKTYAGAVTRMLHANKPAEETAPYLRKIADQVNHANEIVDNSREYVGRRDAGMDWLELNTLVQRAIALTDGMVRKRNVEVRLELDTPLPTLQCYAVQIEQVIINLITNACDAMESVDRDARTLRVQTSKTDEAHVQLVIADSGEGIPADKIDAIFDTFYSSKLDGMGMGLALSRTIVEDHNGQMWAETQPGEGATFHVDLPTEPSDDEQAPAEPPSGAD